MRNDNLYMDIDNIPRYQLEKMPLSDFNALGYRSQLRLKQLHPDIYNRLNTEARKQSEERIKQLNHYARYGYPTETKTEEPAYIRRLRRARRAAENGEG